jgi:hypothetical protein
VDEVGVGEMAVGHPVMEPDLCRSFILVGGEGEGT